MPRLINLATLLASLLLIALAIVTAEAGPKRDAALADCKNIFDDQRKTCPGSGNYAACMTMITDKYESCKANANTIAELDAGGGGGTKKPPKAAIDKLNTAPKAAQ